MRITSTSTNQRNPMTKLGTIGVRCSMFSVRCSILLLAPLLLCAFALNLSAEPSIDPNVLTGTPLETWKWLVPLLVAGVPLVTRAAKVLMNGGGLFGIARAIFWGSSHASNVESRTSNASAAEPSTLDPRRSTLLLLCASVPLWFLTGCSIMHGPVPANSIVIHAPSGDYKVATPKNVAIEKFQAAVDSNGVFRVTFDKWTSTNDPEVIGKSFAGQAAVTREFFNGMNAFAGKLVEGGFKGAAEGIK